MFHLLLKSPIEILAQITSYLRAYDIVWKLGASGDSVLLARLRSGGVTTWDDDGEGDVASKIKFARYLRTLITVTLVLPTTSEDFDKQYVYSLPPTVRHLTVDHDEASTLFDITDDYKRYNRLASPKLHNRRGWSAKHSPFLNYFTSMKANGIVVGPKTSLRSQGSFLAFPPLSKT